MNIIEWYALSPPCLLALCRMLVLTQRLWHRAFGRRLTPQERLRQHQRSLEKAQRELDRERTKLEMQEKKLISDIKKSAKAGQMPACKIMAKDLVRTRRHIQKFYQMKTQLQGIALRIQVCTGLVI